MFNLKLEAVKNFFASGIMSLIERMSEREPNLKSINEILAEERVHCLEEIINKNYIVNLEV